MARKKSLDLAALDPLVARTTPAKSVQQPPAEERYADQLAFLRAVDGPARPPGWLLSPERVVDFLCGTHGASIRAPASADLPMDTPKSMVIEAKFVGSRALVERCVVTLAGERGLLLVGQPGTAKSMLGELLAAAISGTSALTIQGTAGANEDHIRYGWNYAMLLDRGPRPGHANREIGSRRRSHAMFARSAGRAHQCAQRTSNDDSGA
jgi:AAA domain (dynein-related subfamily)